MKNKTFYFLVVILAGILGFYSCEKTEEGSNVRDLIVNNTWVYDTLEISDLTNTGLVLAATFTHLAYAGSEYDFKDDGTYTLTSDLANIDGTWELVEDKTIITDKGTENEEELQIIEINSTEAKLSIHVEGSFFGTPISGDVVLIFKSKQT